MPQAKPHALLKLLKSVTRKSCQLGLQRSKSSNLLGYLSGWEGQSKADSVFFFFWRGERGRFFFWKYSNKEIKVFLLERVSFEDVHAVLWGTLNTKVWQIFVTIKQRRTEAGAKRIIRLKLRDWQLLHTDYFSETIRYSARQQLSEFRFLTFFPQAAFFFFLVAFNSLPKHNGNY